MMCFFFGGGRELVKLSFFIGRGVLCFLRGKFWGRKRCKMHQDVLDIIIFEYGFYEFSMIPK